MGENNKPNNDKPVQQPSTNPSNSNPFGTQSEIRSGNPFGTRVETSTKK